MIDKHSQKCKNYYMTRKNTIAINAHFINNRIKELGLKRSWLAEKIGVDKKTITRWTTGKVKRIAEYNAKALAKCLKCTVEELCDDADIHFLGTQLDRDLAAKEIISENLLLLLSPTGNWKLVETIIKSTISPGLSQESIGKLYNLLAITKWRMKNYQDARVFAQKALDIGKNIEDKAIYVKALFNIGTIDSIIGKNHMALESYLKCYSLKDSFETTGDTASLCTNLSMVYRDLGYFHESIYYQREAVRLFDLKEKKYNISIAYQCFGYIYTEIGEFERAIENLEKAMDYAQKSNYKAGILIITLYKLDALVLSNKLEEIHDDINGHINEFLSGDYNDYFCFEYIARYYRLIGGLKEAEKVIENSLKKIQDSPMAMASLLHERARLALALNDSEGEKKYRKKGNQIYRSIGSNKRVIEKIVPEYGKVFI